MIGWLLGAAALYILKPEIHFGESEDNEVAEMEVIDLEDIGGRFTCRGCDRMIFLTMDMQPILCECGYQYIPTP